MKKNKKQAGKKPAAKKQAASPVRLLSRGEPPAVRIENEKGASPCIILCDHASNRIPKKLGTLGLSARDLNRHIAWDPGTENIGRQLSKAIDAVVFYSSYSRLVVDVNRGPDSPECIRETYDHTRVPGNTGLAARDKKQRIAELFTPYHAAIRRDITRRTAKKKIPLILSVHSFTPEMDGFKRPWHIGLLWNKEGALALRVVKELRRLYPDIVVGENEPYSLKSTRLARNTVTTHAESRGLPYLIVEFRQDLVSTPAKARRWGKMFLAALQVVLDDPKTYRRRQASRL